jgi:hypothetical protein
MIRRFMGAVAMAATMAGGVQAMPTSADFVFNYSGTTGYTVAKFGNYLSTQGVSYQMYGGLNLTGALLGTLAETGMGAPSFDPTVLGVNAADFLDGTFSILWHADDIDAPNLSGVVKGQSDVGFELFQPNFPVHLTIYYTTGISVGQNCIANPSLSVCPSVLPPGPSGSDVPEPTSLALVGIAAVAGIGASRRRRQR